MRIYYFSFSAVGSLENIPIDDSIMISDLLLFVNFYNTRSFEFADSWVLIDVLIKQMQTDLAFSFFFHFKLRVP